eukprot:m.173193 g.173193  ORF g.173193 m.173193 type:complete len:620 (+) comp31717_c9_seq2:142-2001(+)
METKTEHTHKNLSTTIFLENIVKMQANTTLQENTSPKYIPGGNRNSNAVSHLKLMQYADPPTEKLPVPKNSLEPHRPRGRPKKDHIWDEDTKTYIFKDRTESEKNEEKKRKKLAHDPNKPKRAMSPFLYFGKDQRATVMRENPGLEFVGVQKILSDMWKKMDDSQQAKYKAIAVSEMERYKAEMAVYKEPTPDEIIINQKKAKLARKQERLQLKEKGMKEQEQQQQNRLLTMQAEGNMPLSDRHNGSPLRRAVESPKPKGKSKAKAVRTPKPKRVPKGFANFFEIQRAMLCRRYPGESEDSLRQLAIEEWKGLPPADKRSYQYGMPESPPRLSASSKRKTASSSMDNLLEAISSPQFTGIDDSASKYPRLSSQSSSDMIGQLSQSHRKALSYSQSQSQSQSQLPSIPYSHLSSAADLFANPMMHFPPPTPPSNSMQEIQRQLYDLQHSQLQSTPNSHARLDPHMPQPASNTKYGNSPTSYQRDNFNFQTKFGEQMQLMQLQTQYQMQMQEEDSPMRASSMFPRTPKSPTYRTTSSDTPSQISSSPQISSARDQAFRDQLALQQALMAVQKQATQGDDDANDDANGLHDQEQHEHQPREHQQHDEHQHQHQRRGPPLRSV